jgi:hypothetical protein
MPGGQTESLRAREVSRTDRFVLLVLEQSTCRSGKGGAFLHLYAGLVPLALVVCGTDAVLALDMEGEPIEAEALRSRVPGLDALLEPFLDASQVGQLMHWR